MSSCCELPTLIEESVLEECGIPLDLGARFWLHGPGGRYHHRHGPGRFHHHGPHGGHGGSGCGHRGHHGPESGPHGHGWMEHGPHDGPGSEHGGPEGGHHGHGWMDNGAPDQQGNEKPPPGASVKTSGADGAPTTMSTFEEEWSTFGEETSVDDAMAKPNSQLRRARRHPGPHRHGHHHHHGPPPCDKELCIFRKLNLLGENEKADTEAFAALLNQLVARDMAWSVAKDGADKDCIDNDELTNRPFGICEPLHLLVCTTGHIFKNCPEGKWRSDDNCSALKTFMSDCYG